MRTGVALIVLSACCAVVSSAAAKPPHAQFVTPRGTNVEEYALAANTRGERILVAPRDLESVPPLVDVFSAPPGKAFGRRVRSQGEGEPLSEPVAALGPDGSAAIMGTFTSGSPGVPLAVGALAGLARDGEGPLVGPQTLEPKGTDGPDVTFDPAGNATAIWTRDGEKFGTYVETSVRAPGGAWSTPAVIARERRGADTPQIKFDAAGNATAVWTRNGSPVAAARAAGAAPHRRFLNEVVAATRPVGGSFGAPQVISDPRADSDEASVSVAPAGAAGIVWVSLVGADHFRVGAAFRKPGGRFGHPRFLTPLRDDATGTSIALDDRGRGLITWRVSFGTNFRIDAVTRSVGGAISRPRPLSGHKADYGRIVLGPDGRGVVAWVAQTRRGQRVETRATSTRGARGRLRHASAVGELDQLSAVIDGHHRVTLAWTRRIGKVNRLVAATLG